MVLATFGEWDKVSKAVCIDGFTLQHLKHKRETKWNGVNGNIFELFKTFTKKVFCPFYLFIYLFLTMSGPHSVHINKAQTVIHSKTHSQASSSPLRLGCGPPRWSSPAAPAFCQSCHLSCRSSAAWPRWGRGSWQKWQTWPCREHKWSPGTPE